MREIPVAELDSRLLTSGEVPSMELWSWDSERDSCSRVGTPSGGGNHNGGST